MDPRAGRRWPAAVYGRGTEPDARFSLANERTFLAWLRTALALMAAGVALQALGTSVRDGPRDAAALLLVVLGIVAAGNGFWSWARNERALRVAAPLPSPLVGMVVAGGVAVAGVLVALGSLGG